MLAGRGAGGQFGPRRPREETVPDASVRHRTRPFASGRTSDASGRSLRTLVRDRKPVVPAAAPTSRRFLILLHFLHPLGHLSRSPVRAASRASEPRPDASDPCVRTRPMCERTRPMGFRTLRERDRTLRADIRTPPTHVRTGKTGVRTERTRERTGETSVRTVGESIRTVGASARSIRAQGRTVRAETPTFRTEGRTVLSAEPSPPSPIGANFGDRRIVPPPWEGGGWDRGEVRRGALPTGKASETRSRRLATPPSWPPPCSNPPPPRGEEPSAQPKVAPMPPSPLRG
jgi:hypothetical protein